MKQAKRRENEGTKEVCSSAEDERTAPLNIISATAVLVDTAKPFCWTVASLLY